MTDRVTGLQQSFAKHTVRIQWNGGVKAGADQEMQIRFDGDHGLLREPHSILHFWGFLRSDYDIEKYTLHSTRETIVTLETHE